MDFETELAQVAERYRSEGYEVTMRPGGAQLPPFASGFHPDMLAKRRDVQALVQVKESREALRKDPDTARMAEVVNAQPGWRFDLIVLRGGGAEAEKFGKEAAEPSVASLART